VKTVVTLPAWFPSRKVRNSVVDEDSQKKLTKGRVLLLSGKLKQKILKQEVFETEEEYLKRADREVLGHGLLRVAAAADMRVSSWLVETEGDLFSERFKASIDTEKHEIIKYLYEDKAISGEELSRELGEDILLKFHFVNKLELRRKRLLNSRDSNVLRDRSGLKNVLAIRYTEVPDVLKQRKFVLYQGWILGTVESLLSVIKKRFEHQLSDRISQIGEQLDGNPLLEKMSANILGYLEDSETKALINPRYESLGIDHIELDGSVEHNLLILPPCLQELIHKVNATGYLTHWERFQLGIFLKVTGMPIDEQLRYWYNKAVDNVGMTFEEFTNRAGYIIRHIYGMEEGKIDYTMPSCKTIQDKMYCTFKHNSIQNVTKMISEIIDLIKKPALKESRTVIARSIVASTYQFEANKACKYFYSFITGDLSSNPPVISHPLQYLRMAKEKGVIFELNMAPIGEPVNLDDEDSLPDEITDTTTKKSIDAIKDKDTEKIADKTSEQVTLEEESR